MATLPRVSEPGITPNVDLVGAAGIGARAQASLFSEIANSAAQLRSQLQPVLDQQAEARAARDIDQAFAQRSEGDTSLPDLDLRTAWTRQDQVYNNAITAGALARAGIDAEAEATRLRERFPYDPGGFENAYNQFVEGYIENAPTQIGSQIELSMLRTFSREHSRIAEQTRLNAINEEEQALTSRLAHLDEQMRQGIREEGNGFVDSEAGGDIAAQYADIINILVDNPAFDRSAEWGADQLDNFVTQTREGVMVEHIRTTFRDGGAAAALQEIDDLRSSFTGSDEEWISTRSSLVGEVNMLQTIESTRRAERNRMDELDRERIEELGNDFFARAIEARMGGNPLPEDLIREIPSLVRVGAITEAQARQWSGAGSGAIIENDQLVVSLMNEARYGSSSQEELRARMNEHIGVDLTSETYNRILDKAEEWSDDRLQAGRDVIGAMFRQGVFDTINTSLALNEQIAIGQLEDWAAQNPEAGVQEARRQARLIGISLGRDIDQPTIPYGSPPPVNGTRESFEVWENTVLDYVAAQDDSGRWPSQEGRAAFIERYESFSEWWSFQYGLSQEQANLNNAQ